MLLKNPTFFSSFFFFNQERTVFLWGREEKAPPHWILHMKR